MAWKPAKIHKETSAGESKQRKGNVGEEKRTVHSAKSEFWEEIKRKSCDREGGKRMMWREGRKKGRGVRGKRSMQL